MGLVRRDPDLTDRRRVWLSLTDRGKAYVRRRYAGFRKALSALLGSLTKDEVWRLNDSLYAIIETMKKL